MVAVSNTIVQVRTVMVEPFNTHVSNIAMSTSRCSDDFTIRTNVVGISIIKQFLEIYIRVSSDVARIHQSSKRKERK